MSWGVADGGIRTARGVGEGSRDGAGPRAICGVAAAVVLLAVAPAAASDEPVLSPGAATAIPASITLGLGGAAALALTLSEDDNDAAQSFGVAAAVVAALTPELGYYTTGHVARGVGMFFLRTMAAGSLGYLAGIGVWAASDPCPPQSDPYCGLTVIIAATLGSTAAQLIFMAFEWWDTFATVEADWEAYRGSTEDPDEPATAVASAVVVPTLLDPGRGGGVPGLQLLLRW